MGLSSVGARSRFRGTRDSPSIRRQEFLLENCDLIRYGINLHFFGSICLCYVDLNMRDETYVIIILRAIYVQEVEAQQMWLVQAQNSNVS